jgi:hypothetical protein
MPSPRGLSIAVLTSGEVTYMNLNLTTNLGMLLLGIWLIVTGLLTALSIGNPIVHVLLALLAIAAGVLIVLNR